MTIGGVRFARMERADSAKKLGIASERLGKALRLCNPQGTSQLSLTEETIRYLE